MVVTNRLFHILSIVFLITGIVLSAVGITLIIVSSTTQCTLVEPIATVSPTTCQSTMFGTQVTLADEEWKEDLKDPESQPFKSLSAKVSKSIVDALESSSSTSGMMMIAAIESDVTYEVKVNQFTSDGKHGTIAYASGVALSTGETPSVPDIKVKISQNPDIGDTTQVNENELVFCADIPPPSDSTSYPECPICTTTICPIMETTECPSVIQTECPLVVPTDCPSIPQTECPILTPTDCPSVIPTECPVIPSTECPSIIPTECPPIPPTDCSTCNPTTICPSITPTECPLNPSTSCPICSPSTDCPSIISTDCPLQITTECPPFTQTECPHLPPDCSTCPVVVTTDCPDCSSTDCPIVNTTACPSTSTTVCPICPVEVTTECPSVTPTECPLIPTDCSSCSQSTNCPSIIPTDCPINPSTDCPITTECPSIIPTECPLNPSTDCPSVISTDCPSLDCTLCPSHLPTTSSTCPIFSCTDCPKEDCPSTQCPSTSTDTLPVTCPSIIPTDCPTVVCPSTDCPLSTECPAVTSSTDAVCPMQTCHSTMFGTRVSLDQTQAAWDPQLGIDGSQLFNDTAAYVSQMIINALEGTNNGRMILAASEVTYEVKVNQFIEGDNKGTYAFTSGVAMSTGSIDNLPSVYDIQKNLDDNLKEAMATVDDNELDFCPYLIPTQPCITTLSTQGTPDDHTTVSTTVPEVHSTTQEQTITQSTKGQDTTDSSTITTNGEDTAQSSTTILVQTTSEETEIRSTHPSTRLSQSTEGTSSISFSSIQYTTTQENEQSTTVINEDKTTPSTIIESTTHELEYSTSSIEPSHHSSTSEGSVQSTTEANHNTVVSSVIPEEISTTNGPIPSQSDQTDRTVSYETTIAEGSVSSSKTPDIHHSTTEAPVPTASDSSTIQSSSNPDGHSTTNEPLEITTSVNGGSTTESNEFTSQSPVSEGSTSQVSLSTGVSSSTEESKWTTEESKDTTNSNPTSSTESHTSPHPDSSSSSVTEESMETSKGTNEPINSSTPSDTHSTTESSSSTESPDAITTVSPQITTVKSEDTTIVGEITTILTTLIPSTSTEIIPSTAACTGREVINADVFLLFDYTGTDAPDDGTKEVEEFISKTLFSFEGNDFSFDRDPTSTKIPLQLYLVHYPTKDNDEYTQFVTKPITSLDQLSITIYNLINSSPPASTESKMKDALTAIYTTSSTINPPTIILISKSDSFVDEAIDIAKQLQTDKKFNIIGVPLIDVDLTSLTNYNALPLDFTSIDSQVQTATEINDLLMSFGKACVDAIPTLPTTTTPKYTTPSTTPNVPTTRFYCETGLKEQSIAFLYQMNYQQEQSSLIINELLKSPEVSTSGNAAFTAFFPYPLTDGYPVTAAHTWNPLNGQMLPLLVTTVLHAPPDAMGASIVDGIQSLIDHPDDQPGYLGTNNIVVIIANSANDDDVSAASSLIDSSPLLKDSSTIITLSYGSTLSDLSSLASSSQFTLIQKEEDPVQASSLLLNSLLQAACQ